MVSLGNQFFSGISNAAEEFTILNSAQILTPDIKAEIVDVGNYVRFPDGSIQSTAASSGLGATHVLTGDVNKTAGSVSLTGDADSDFYSELFVGDKIFVYNASLTAGEIRTVETIISSLSLTVDIPFNNTASSVAAWKLGPVMTQTANTASLNNIIMGANSGNPDNITGTYNICVGNGAGAGLVGGIENIRIGHNAGLSGTTPSNTIAMGYYSGFVNQGNYAIAIGSTAGSTNQSIYAISIGNDAGNTSQSPYAISIGYQAGRDTQGDNGIAIGYEAGEIKQSDNSIAIGYQAAQGSGANGQGLYGVAIGYQACWHNSSPHCTSIGYYSNFVGTTGTGKTSVGSYAGFKCGINGVAIGHQACYNDDEADNIVAIGKDAHLQTAESGQNGGQIAIGQSAGRNSQKTGAIAIGESAGYGNQVVNEGQGSYAIAIGYYAGRGTAGPTKGQADHSIILNATGSALDNTTTNSCVIKPIAQTTGEANCLFYEIGTGQVKYEGSIKCSAPVSGVSELILDNGDVSLADNGTISVTVNPTALVFIGYDYSGSYYGGLFFADYASSTVIAVANPSTTFVINNSSSTGYVNVYKSGTSSTLTIENATGGARDICVQIIAGKGVL
jgi:hypothetical protein